MPVGSITLPHWARAGRPTRSAPTFLVSCQKPSFSRRSPRPRPAPGEFSSGPPEGARAEENAPRLPSCDPGDSGAATPGRSTCPSAGPLPRLPHLRTPFREEHTRLLGGRRANGFTFLCEGQEGGLPREGGRGARTREARPEMSPASLVRPTRGQNVSVLRASEGPLPREEGTWRPFLSRGCARRPLGAGRWPRAVRSPAPADGELRRGVRASRGTAALTSRPPRLKARAHGKEAVLSCSSYL